jgi:uncharacterized OB-fold protein
MSEQIIKTPSPVMGSYDGPLWESINKQELSLQQCTDCKAFRYPPGPMCSECLSEDSQWTPVSGKGEILSWVVFHRTYLPAYPAPYNVIAVRLEEGPIFISNLDGEVPEGSWVDKEVKLRYRTMGDGVILPRFELAS